MWFTKKKLAEQGTDVETNMLFGVDLSKFHYLGYSEFYFTDSNKRWQCHFFLSHNEKKRLIKLTGNTSSTGYQFHPYYTKSCLLWQAGEGIWYACATDYQSLYLQEKMLEDYDAVWDTEKKWWVANEQAKYDQAYNQQKENTKPQVSTDTNDNVVKINFTKDKI